MKSRANAKRIQVATVYALFLHIIETKVKMATKAIATMKPSNARHTSPSTGTVDGIRRIAPRQTNGTK